MGELKHRITVRLSDPHVTHLQELANASGLTRNEVMRRVLSNTDIPSARTRKEVQDILRIQREQNRLGGLLKKALRERQKRPSFVAPSVS
ncbi:MAG: ribbon-helix-helix protein, CopG family [Polyangiales bacterium]